MIIVADLHLGDVHDSILVDCPEVLEFLHRFGKVSSRTVETFLRLREALDYAMEKKQSFIVAGDVFDSVRPDPRVVSQFIELVEEYRPYVPFYVVPGNHDADAVSFSTYPLEAMFGSTAFVHEICQRYVDNTLVCFIPHLNELALAGYAQFGYWEAAVKNVLADTKIIVTHGTVVGYQEQFIDEELSRANMIDPTHFDSGMTIIIGHYHQPRNISKDGVHVVVPGSVPITSFADVEEKLGFCEYNPKTDSTKWHLYKTVIVPYRQYDISKKGLLELEGKDLSACEGAIVKVVVEADSRGDVDEVAIRKLFGAAAKIAKFEVRLSQDVTREAEKPISVKNQKPVTLLTHYLKNQEKAGIAEGVVKVALTEGKKIIEKVVSA